MWILAANVLKTLHTANVIPVYINTVPYRKQRNTDCVCFLRTWPQTLLRNQLSPGHSGWQTTSDSPEGPLFQNPIRQNSEQYYLCVCVYIYYIANEQIAAMWHGLVARLLKKETHTHTGSHTDTHTQTHTPPPHTTTHTLQSPVFPFPSFHHNTHTHAQPQGPQCSLPVCPSAHVERWAGSTYHHSAEWRPHKGPLTSHTHTHMHAHNSVSTGRLLGRAGLIKCMV